MKKRVIRSVSETSQYIKKIIYGWITAISLFATFCTILLTFTYLFDNFHTKKEPIELSNRIEIISTDLKSASAELTAIQSELEQRIALVEQLKKEADTAETMISLTKEQVNSIRATLNAELNRDSSKSFWVSIAINAFFMVLGALVSYFVQKLLDRLHSSPRSCTPIEKSPTD